MGYTFNLEHANIVAYLTAPIDWFSFDADEILQYDRMIFNLYERYLFEFPERLLHHKLFARQLRHRKNTSRDSHFNHPRFNKQNILSFLYTLDNGYHSRIISPSDNFTEILNMLARKAIHVIRESEGDDKDEPVSVNILNKALFELKYIFASFTYYGLVIGSSKDESLTSLFRKAARDSGGYGLFLVPDDLHKNTLSILDPFPQISLISKRPEAYPGIIFWSSDGTSTLVPAKEAEKFTYSLINASENNPFEVSRLIQENEINFEKSKKTILHLSDLHFGSKDAKENEEYLLLHIQKIKKSFNRVVLSGDLCDNPVSADLKDYQNFKDELKIITGKNPIVVLGNHDHKILGNFPSLKKADFGTGSSYPRIVKDHSMKCLFFCFDSCAEVQMWASGKITQSQLTKIATLFERECLKQPHIKDYFRIAVVHHHPLPYQSGSEQEVQSGWKAIVSMANEQLFLKMENGPQFVQWCAEFNIRAVLHGHKHWQRYVEKQISLPQNRGSRKIRAIGCGTSLGKGSKPMTYNLVSWDDSTQAWGALFFQDNNRSGYFSKNLMLFVVN